ncbi:terminase [Pontibaca sp. S1109L]|uniref:Terminase n=1 Tax=Pontibaca salina TaxID=2795731 RepID=A0A934HK41_9RHOB|nr:terminase [Pontibaca salina]
MVEGPSAGKPLKLGEWQKDFIRGALDPDYQYAILSCGRGAGKTMLLAAISLSGLMGVWDNQPSRQIICAARTAEQARIIWHYTRLLIETLPEEEQAKFSVKQAPRLEIHYEGNGNGMLKAIAADAKNALGLSPAPLIVCDEVGHWPDEAGAELYAALESSMGKRMAKMILISTSASSDLHFFSKLIDEPNDNAFVVEHRAPDGKPLDDLDGIKLANPGCEHGVGAPLNWLVDQAKRAIKRGGHAASSFRLYHLNQRVQAENNAVFLTTDEYLKCEVSPDELPPRDGPCVAGVDLGGSRSQSAMVFYWPETGRTEAYAAFPSNPSLADRGIADGVRDRYVEMEQRGELVTIGDRVVPPGPWLKDMVEKLDGYPIAAIVGDRYRWGEFQDALKDAGLERVPFVPRGNGYRDGGEDTERARSAVFDNKVKLAPSLLMRSAMSDAIVVIDDSGNQKLTKKRSLGRIDAVSALVVAVAEGQRMVNRPKPKAPAMAWG